MAAITLKEIAASYDAGRKRLSGELSEAEAISLLTTQYDMNRSSANAYVDALRHMTAGEVFKRTINAPAAEYYIDRIAVDFGTTAARSALTALKLHIAYYEPTRGITCRELRRVVDKFAYVSPDKSSVDTAQAALEHAVEKSLKLLPKDRKPLLPPDGHKPHIKQVQTTTYIRNPHVIAEVLLRANGICEHCHKPAPFTRKSNGLPYLEVHHLIRLADGGDDTVGNAEAVCPNCHRWRHYGE